MGKDQKDSLKATSENHDPSARWTGSVTREPRPVGGERGALKKLTTSLPGSPRRVGGELHIFRPCTSSLRCKDETRAEALKQSSLRALRCGSRAPRKISNARPRDPILKLHNALFSAITTQTLWSVLPLSAITYPPIEREAFLTLADRR
jgi:hypothetical protein